MSFLGGPEGIELLLQLVVAGAVTAAAASAVRRAPDSWQRCLPDLVFAALLCLQLAFLAHLSALPLQIDIDTERSAAALSDTRTLDEVVRLRGVWSADYILQGPLVHGLRRLLPLEPLGVYRLLAMAGGAATALLLRGVARRLGAGPWPAALAGLFPLCSFGGAWIALSLDDNAFASALQWCFFFALLRALDAHSGRRLAWMLGVGVLLGIAVSMHRKALLWAGLVPLAPLVSLQWRTPRAIQGLAVAAGAALTTHLAAAGLLLPTGFGAATLSQLVSSAHHQHTGWWFPGSEAGWSTQARAVWDGLHASLVTFPVLRDRVLEAGALHYFDVLVAACVVAVLGSAWRMRHRPGCRLLAVGIGIQALHSLLYESHNVERWDMVVGGSAVLVAVSVSQATPRAGIERAAAASLWGVLVAAAHLTLRWHPAL